jgi:hypothetical protein
MDPERKKEPIKVTDRRSFTSSGEKRAQSADEAPAAPQRPESEPVRGPGFQMQPPPQPAGVPAVDFSSFILSLSSTAFIHLGEIEDPATGQRQVSLEEARQIIDIIEMLRQRTRGNLAPEEQRLLEGVLYELRMRYTQRATSR